MKIQKFNLVVGTLLVLSLIVLTFLLANKVSAATNITSVADQTVTVGDTVSVEVKVNRTKTGPAIDLLNTSNDWQSTEINGVCFNKPDLFLGTGVATSTFSMGIATSSGTSSVSVKVFRLDGCDDNLFLAGKPFEDETSFELTVKEVPMVTPGTGEKSKGGGGSHASAAYYGFTTEADKVRFAIYEERMKMLAAWRARLCAEVGFACGK